ncbi:MAG: NUDIX domain-containing protein [Marinobacterium sp.]|nr:NUDIX domain-containing protein [Marinobacterium sp.]
MADRWTPAFTRDDVEVTAETPLYQGFFSLKRLSVTHRTFSGGTVSVERELFWRDDAVGVLLFDPDRDQVVLVEQFRPGAIDHPHSPWSLELVAGVMEPSEQPEQVARREAEEEAGATLGELMPITRYMSSPGGSHEYVWLYCAPVDASTLGGIHGLADEGEDIQVHCLPVQQAFEMVAQGLIDNAATIITLQWLQLHHDRLKQHWEGPDEIEVCA